MVDLYDAKERFTALGELVDRRLAAGGDTPLLVELHMTKARLARSKADTDGAVAALNASLGLDPRHVGALRQLATLYLETESWEPAAEVLIRIARIRHDPSELRWAFFTLGDIYERHLDDQQRAQTAYERVLGVVPHDVETLSRLASLYSAGGRVDDAIALLNRLVKRAATTSERRDYQIRISRVHEENDDARRAEQELEALRRKAPLQLDALTALADFYKRQDASTALTVHLNRGSTDLRRAIDRDPQNESLWKALIRVVMMRHGAQPAARIADAAAAVGVIDFEFTKANTVPEPTSIDLAIDNTRLVDQLAPPALSVPLRKTFTLTAALLDKILPFDPKAWRAKKLTGSQRSLAAEVAEVAKLLGIGGAKVLTTDVAPRVCVPVSTKPLTLVIGRDLASIVDKAGRQFLFARALHIAIAGLAPSMRVPSEDIARALAGFVYMFEPSYAPAEVDAKSLASAAKRWSKLIRRRDWDEVGSLALELAERDDFRPGAIALAAAEYGNRSALLTYGRAQAAVNALLALSGNEIAHDDHSGKMQAILDTPEAWSVLRFGISEEYLEARMTHKKHG